MLHPVWMPTLAILVAFAIDPHLTFTFDTRGQWIIVGMIFIMTALFPIISTLMIWRSGAISELAMPVRRERILPFLLSLIYFCMAYYMMRRTPNVAATLALFSGCMVALAATVLITFGWKISAHMVGVGGLVGVVGGLMLIHGAQAPVLLGVLFLLVGALGTARLIVTDHTPAQIYIGGLLGLFCTFSCVLFRLYF
ncbi:MAG: hypothetical protein ABI373_06785 [Flavobacteriales bacterium]